MNVDSFSITSDYLRKEIFEIDDFLRKTFIPQYKKEVLELYEKEYKEKFEDVVLHYEGKNQLLITSQSRLK